MAAKLGGSWLRKGRRGDEERSALDKMMINVCSGWQTGIGIGIALRCFCLSTVIRDLTNNLI